MRRWLIALALGTPLTLLAGGIGAQTQPGAQPAAPQGSGLPHGWLLGSWTGGIYPAGDTEGERCIGQPTVIFTRDIVLRQATLDIAYRQRPIETVAAAGPDGVEFRLAPPAPAMTAMGPRIPPDSGFGCDNPNVLRVERRGPNEIAFPGCRDFPSTLKRCVSR
jgi:hypothetical protein